MGPPGSRAPNTSAKTRPKGNPGDQIYGMRITHDMVCLDVNYDRGVSRHPPNIDAVTCWISGRTIIIRAPPTTFTALPDGLASVYAADNDDDQTQKHRSGLHFLPR